MSENIGCVNYALQVLSGEEDSASEFFRGRLVSAAGGKIPAAVFSTSDKGTAIFRGHIAPEITVSPDGGDSFTKTMSRVVVAFGEIAQELSGLEDGAYVQFWGDYDRRKYNDKYYDQLVIRAFDILEAPDAIDFQTDDIPF